MERYLSDEELWKEITKHAEERSGEYVPVDDIELNLNPLSPLVEETNDTNYQHEESW